LGEIEITRNKHSLVRKYFIMCFAILAFLPIPALNARAVASDRWHAGYGYDSTAPYGDEDAPLGVKANVYTISPSIPWFSQMCQWVSVIISYTPGNGYWIQLGYLKKFQFWVTYSFYVEKRDTGGLRQWLLPLGFPETSHTYSYAIWWDPIFVPGGTWRYAIVEGTTWLFFSSLETNPHGSVDLQVSAESTKSTISIEGSHFTQITYYDDSAPLNWRFWNDHRVLKRYPYWVEEEGDYEFFGHSY
jgi:hypothetical protein